MQRLTGDFITSKDIGHLKKLGTVITRSSFTIFFSLFFFCLSRKEREREREIERVNYRDVDDEEEEEEEAEEERWRREEGEIGLLKRTVNKEGTTSSILFYSSVRVVGHLVNGVVDGRIYFINWT